MRLAGVFVSRDLTARGWSLLMRRSPFKGGRRVFIRRKHPRARSLLLSTCCHHVAIVTSSRSSQVPRVTCGWCLLTRRHLRSRGEVVAFGSSSLHVVLSRGTRSVGSSSLCPGVKIIMQRGPGCAAGGAIFGDAARPRRRSGRFIITARVHEWTRQCRLVGRHSNHGKLL
jgi:hypothetical protein